MKKMVLAVSFLTLFMTGSALSQGHVPVGQYADGDKIVAASEWMSDFFAGRANSLCDDLKDLVNDWRDEEEKPVILWNDLSQLWQKSCSSN